MAKKKSKIYKDGDTFIFRHLIRPDFKLNQEPLSDPNEAFRFELDNLHNPNAIFEGLKRNIVLAKEAANQDPDVALIDLVLDFERELDVIIAAYSRSETDFVAVRMFHLGRNLEKVNLFPAVSAAQSHAVRGDHAQASTHKELNEHFSDLPDKALELLEANPGIRLKGLSGLLTQYYGGKESTVRERLKKLHKKKPFLPDYCFKSGRPPKP